VPLLQLRLDLLHRLEADAHDDQDRGPTEGEALVGVEVDQREDRDEADQAQIERTGQRDAGQDVVEVLGRGPPRADAGMKPPYFFMFSATSSGLNVIAT
jgi:hypothetical protein